MPPNSDNIHSLPRDIDMPSNLVWEALQKSTAVIESARNDLRSLKEEVEEGFSGLESTMNTHTAHIDNLVRELGRTNDLHEKEIKDRQEAKILAMKKIEAEKEDRNERKELAIRIGHGLWDFFKMPLGTVITGISAWIVYTYFLVP